MARTLQFHNKPLIPQAILPNYPGLGLPVRYVTEQRYGFYPIGAHEYGRGAMSDVIPVRELAMMDIMEKLTDKEDWHSKVVNEEIVARWRKEALAIPDEQLWDLAISGKRQYWDNNDGGWLPDEEDYDGIVPPEGIMNKVTFDCCVEELRSKAKYFEETGIVPTLDACASVAKSDKLVSAELHDALRNAFDKLKTDQETSPDWHPNSNDMVQDLVHPSMYPLVYGRSLGFYRECVGVGNAIDQWAGTGDVAPGDDVIGGDARRHDGQVSANCWSDTYQWLPANVVFQRDGNVKFTSYINNLHPAKYPDIYRTIEKLVKLSLPMWDQCLAIVTDYDQKDGAGRTAPRFGKPDNPDDENGDNWLNTAEDCAREEVTEEKLHELRYRPEYSDLSRIKWELFRKPKIPEPSFKNIEYAPEEGKRLADYFYDSGLQIIVKMASIELTPEKPEFPIGGWHVEGQMNEHICATALYYLDSENITNSSLSFRMQTSMYMNDDKAYNVGQDAYHWMERIYGTSLGCNTPCLQNYGSVETRQGRLLAFPNVFQHRVSPFRLIDPTKPGHRRFIALWLVDPTQRIISTANIPPQQMTWYADSLLGSTPSARIAALSILPPELVALLVQHGLNRAEASENCRLPAELMDMVKEYFEQGQNGLPMSVEEAMEHRTKLMQERGAFHRTAEGRWQEQSYNFCEH
ncbi:uncharacterized protein K460DRAFT_305120 [Cucurbitaria berberidis CBS 394.84]|uniref:Uncharacterized protein n=1 Tax=Cucurbitaria berberidis CBS 394.84 TaxID=1168544 RepID=A0A9P4GPI8_9PLEO|nr:uncharacterized protein K460DRAFT_305120 [Cucurbitaria berberidis CBS 394.84]KAF1849209.1 hypothetical protein K460DRAFT_305120 [Cucurbitaria berberidis CBS 394.84]